RRTTSAKSPMEMVRPIPNIMTPNSTGTHGTSGVNTGGAIKPATAKSRTHQAKVFPTNCETVASIPTECPFLLMFQRIQQHASVGAACPAVKRLRLDTRPGPVPVQLLLSGHIVAVT